MDKPALEFSNDVREELEKHPEARRQALRQWFEERLLPSYLLTSKRASPSPQRPSLLGRMLGRQPAPPVLAVDASKFGGQPYLESPEDWPRHGTRPFEYLAQVNFRDLDGHVPDAPRQGLLVFYLRRDWPCDQPGQCRWYPNPDPSRAVIPGDAGPTVARFETKISFVPSWTLPASDAWEDALGRKDEFLWEALLEWQDQFDQARGYDDGSHELFPQATSALLEELHERELTHSRTILRVSFDNEADFGWGTNWVYFLLKNDDLRAGRFDRVTCRTANT